jgi:antitoxin HigA-1
MTVMSKKLPPVHPGEVLREEFLRPMNLSAYAVARDRRAAHAHRAAGQRADGRDHDTALRLARYFGTSAAFWMGMQAQHDLERAEDELGSDLRKIASVRAIKSAA